MAAPATTIMRRIIEVLTTPHPSIRGEETQRRVRLFILLGLLGLLSTILTLGILVIVGYPLSPFEFLIVPAALTILGLGHTRWYPVGMAVAILVNYGWAISTILGSDRRDYASLLLLMPVVFVSLLFSARVTALTGLTSVVLAIVIGSTQNGLTDVVAFAGLFIFMILIGITTAADLRERDNRKLVMRAEALARSESRYRTLFNSSPIPLSEEDYTAMYSIVKRLQAQGVSDIEAYFHAHPEVVEDIFRSLEVIEVNPATLSLYRSTSVEEFTHYFSPQYFERNPAGLAGSLAEMWRGEMEHAYEAVDFTLDGEPFDCRIRWVRLSDHPLRVVISIEDLTPIKQAERHRQERDIERARVDMLQRFLGDTTHDLLTPITIINTSVYLGLLTQEVTQVHNRLATIQVQANHLQTMIQDMLTISRLDNPTETAFNFEVGDFNDALGRIVSEFMPLAQEKRQEITYAPAQHPLPIRYDDHTLGRALRNLIQNAIKYTPNEGSIAITSRGEGDQMVIDIGDSGIGIPAAELSHIFDRFYRADAHRPTDGGTGLGLAIVKKIIDAHAGQITVQSAPGCGTTFTIWLPLVEVVTSKE